MKETFIPQSENIAEVAFDGDGGTLTVTFKDGRAYEYSGVPQEVYMGMQRAPSVGSYFHRNVRSRYNYTEI